MLPLLLALAAAAPAEEPPCAKRAVALLRHDVEGLRVYKALEDRAGFLFWVDCTEPDLGVPSAVHESVHLLSGRTDDHTYALYASGGEQLLMPMGHTPPRSLVVPMLRPEERDGYVQTYLSGPSGEQGFELLLDELNAYVFGLRTHRGLAEAGRLGDRVQAARDGVAHFQLYLGLYLRLLRVSEPERHAALAKTHGPVVARVWKDAEAELKASTDWPGLGLDDRWYLARAYDPELLAELDRFVGGRVWSTTLQKRFTADPPAGPTPPERHGGRVTQKRSNQRRVRATVILGESQYSFEESSVPGSVVLLRDGERLDVRTWEQVEALELPEAVQEALREARKPLAE